MASSWFEHPKYVRTRERLIESLTSTHYRFRRSDPVVFLFGGEKSVARDELAAYLKKYFPTLLLFYAEVVWDLIASRLKLGALKMESDLAALADLVIIIVESPGTFAELGAFSNSDPLRRKLLPILDIQYQPPQKSFLALGPYQMDRGMNHRDLHLQYTFASTAFLGESVRLKIELVGFLGLQHISKI